MSNNKVKKSAKPDKKKFWTKTKTLIASIIAVLTLITLLTDLPKKICEAYKLFAGDELISTPLRGRVINNVGDPIEGAILKIDELPSDSVITTSDGGFYFAEVPGKPGVRVRLSVISKEFRLYNEYVTLPGPVTIKLEE
ncbi:MAG: hypothetical protein Q8M94_11345 [Ignavibacteria bacterium]|nr:hypothetical protein [Ignavibacteria bacterium]